MKNDEKWDEKLNHLSVTGRAMFHMVMLNNIAQQKQIRDSAFQLVFPVFHRLTVVQVSFCSLTKRITPKICRLCFFPNKQHSFEPFICLDFVLER